MIRKIYNNFIQKSKLHKETRITCGYVTIDECPYNSESECRFEKTKCLLIANKKNRKGTQKSILPVILFALVGMLIYIVVTILSNTESFQFTYSLYVYNVLSGIGISVVTGAILAIVIDLPSRLRDYENSFVNALTSNNYLKSLDENRLANLRNDITEQLHKVTAPCMAKGLIKIDQSVCDLLRLPYYTRYRHTVKCTPIENTDYVEKEHSIDYKLINPYSVNQDAIEFIHFTNLILTNGNEEDKQEAFKDFRITCRIDDGVEQNLSDKVELVYEKIDKDTKFYDTKVTVNSKDNRLEEKLGIRVPFKESLVVNVHYKIKVHKEDICFTKRLQHPAKNFRLDYTYNDPNGKLYGQIFGTLMKQAEISIKYTNENSISLETFDWLLPSNGAIVVMLNK